MTPIDIPTMQAAVLVQQRQPLQLWQVELPPALDFGQVLVRIAYSGICGSQLNEIDGGKGDDPYLPHLLGHEASGTVLAVGAGVRSVTTGDQVVVHWRLGAGLQSEVPRYHYRGQRVNAGSVTTFNSYAVLSENRVTAVAPDLDPRILALFGCAVTTAAGIVNNDAKVKLGESVVVFGVGGVGLNVVQAAALVSAQPIVGIDLHTEKLQLARKFGATEVINATSEDVDRLVHEAVGSDGADVVVETTGNARVIERAYALTAAAGRTILVGVPAKEDKASLHTLPLHFDKVLTGSHGGSARPDQDIPRLLKLHRSGRLHFDGMITHEFPLAQVNEAIAVARSGLAGRVVLRCQDDL